MDGRTQDQKAALARHLLNALETVASEAGSLTVEVNEIDQSIYAKRVR